MAPPPKSEFELNLERNNKEWQKAVKGEMFVSFDPELIAARDKCASACEKFNSMPIRSRRDVVRGWREITCNPLPLPPPAAAQVEDDALFDGEPWVTSPVRCDMGFNVHIGRGTFVNFNTTFIDSLPITIGDRVLVAPNCSFYSGRHPIDPAIRNGLEGPEDGRPITVGDDCWIGGNVIILPGVTIGRGCTVGAGSVVTKDVPPFHVVAGNPARIIRKIETAMDTQDQEQNWMNKRYKRLAPDGGSSTLYDIRRTRSEWRKKEER